MRNILSALPRGKMVEASVTLVLTRYALTILLSQVAFSDDLHYLILTVYVSQQP